MRSRAPASACSPSVEITVESLDGTSPPALGVSAPPLLPPFAPVANAAFHEMLEFFLLFLLLGLALPPKLLLVKLLGREPRVQNSTCY